MGYFYFANGKLPAKLEDASPLLLDQQRKLDAKVNRLLDAIEAMRTSQHQNDEPKEPKATTMPLPADHSENADPPSGDTAGLVIRK